ncbi:MBL fold metallo-hydrolase [candidate division KSB1 bacterium]|nr:MBL fold metallo-hydrolase [Candidatus Aminicenantes bacterium]RQW03583.1 MAG: MBL fold metallo-hydrolase [candidate division KSB1 bacterium]
MPYLKLEVGELQTNMYLFYSELSRRCFIIDPGAEAEKIIKLVEREKLMPQAIILTHGHADHLGAVTGLLVHFHIPLWIHEADEKTMHGQMNREIAALFAMSLPSAPERLLKDGEIIGNDDLVLTVIHSPGHTPGSMLLHGGNLLFTGDTLFQGDVGRTDLPGGDDEAMRSSLNKIRAFPPETIILPGHGEVTTMEKELASNPYL